MTLTSTHQKTTAHQKSFSEDVAWKGRRDAVSGVDSSTFGEGVRLLPSAIQDDVRQLYYVLRTIDDLVDDGHPDAPSRLDAVECWANGAQSLTEETRILNGLAARHPFDRAALLEFCDGMRHDLAGEHIANEDALEGYCQQAGGSVGVLLSGLLGGRGPECAEKMAMLGRAMQRTNILRDIDEDYESGRVYVATTTIERYGVPVPGAREMLLRDQIARADSLYDEGLPAIAMLSHGRLAMGLATALYREILREIERSGYGVKPGRVSVPAHRAQYLARRHRENGRDPQP
jgi:15-cis-phytoene synthase